MKKNFATLLTVGLILFGLTGVSRAELTTIGTATSMFWSEDYNLIWDDDNNGKSLIWLDYTNTGNTWLSQKTWAQMLEANDLTCDINPSYTVSWIDTSWRLPDAGINPQQGYGQTTSEMGHLYYVELGLSADGNTTAEQLNASNFDHLAASWYWTSTPDTNNTDKAWVFYMGGDQYSGAQGPGSTYLQGKGLAVRSARVSGVPVPAALWLLGSGLAGLAAMIRRRKGIFS